MVEDLVPTSPDGATRDGNLRLVRDANKARSSIFNALSLLLLLDRRYNPSQPRILFFRSLGMNFSDRIAQMCNYVRMSLQVMLTRGGALIKPPHAVRCFSMFITISPNRGYKLSAESLSYE